MRCLALMPVFAVLVGCGEGPEQAYERGYDDGYYEGRRDVCKEVEREAGQIEDQLRNCRGF
jgi:hypothetical protein